MANGANLTVEQFTETVAKQIAADLKLDGTDFVNRLVSSLSKGLIDKIAQKQITSPITQQLENQQQESDKSSKELEKLNKTSASTNTSIETHLPKLVEGINVLGQKMQDSFQLLSKDFTGAIGKTNSIFKSFTDKLIDVSSSQKEDKFPHLIKRQFVSLENHLTELFKTKNQKAQIEPQKLTLGDLLKDFDKNLQKEILSKIEGVSLKDLPEQLKTEALSKIEGVSLKDLPEQLKTELVTNLLKTLPEDLKIEIASKIQTTSLENLPEQLKTEIVAKFQDISFVNFNEELRRAIVEKIKGVSFEELPKEVAKEIKTIFENSTTQREQTKQFQDLGKDQNEHLKKAVETLRDILGSSEELIKLQDKQKSEPERFWDSFKKLPEAIESKIGEKLKGAAYSILPKSLTSFVSKFVEGKPEEKDSKGDVKELKEAIKQSQKTKEQPKSVLEATEQVQKVEIDSISGTTSNQLLDILPTAIKEGISQTDEKIGKILEFLETKLISEIQKIDAGEGGINLARALPIGRRGARTAAAKRRARRSTAAPSTKKQPTSKTPTPKPKASPVKGGGAGKGLGKTILKRAGIVGAIAGAGLTAAELYDISQAEKKGDVTKEEASKMKGGALGGAAGSIGGGLGGAAAGAALGTLIFPGVGTVVGGLIGGVAGGIGGEWLGRKGGETIAESTTAKPEQPPMVAEQVEKPQKFIPLQPKEEIPTIESVKEKAPKIEQTKPETPKIKETTVQNSIQPEAANNTILNQIASGVETIKQNTIALVTGINKIGNLPRQVSGEPQQQPSPVVINNTSSNQPPTRSTEIAKQTTSAIPNYRGFAMQTQPRYV